MLRLLTSSLLLASSLSLDVNCEKCIDRPKYIIKAIVHSTKSNPFMLRLQAASVQAGKDMNVDLQMELYDTFSDTTMAKNIVSAATGDSRPDALVVSIPSDEVAEAVKTAVDAGMPVFGFNSGYSVASDLGVLGFVSMDEYRGGTEAANAMLATSSNITNALFINFEKGNLALDDRRDGFAARLAEINEEAEVKELVVVQEDPNVSSKISAELDGCPYDAVLLSTSYGLLEHIISVNKLHSCEEATMIGTFDTSSEVFNAITLGDVVFAVSQQEHLQGALPIVMASIFATTGKAPRLALIEDSEYGVYLTGPKVFMKDDVPSDTLQTCMNDSFPVCPNANNPFGSKSMCACTERSSITIGGVLHGVTTDSFWDEVFAASEQAARDMGVKLKLDRMKPEKDSVLFSKMAGKIESLCKEGVDGMFVTIPNERVVEAIELCLELNVPVISINSGAETSEALGLMHHIGPVEYDAGIRAGSRLFNYGMKKGYCLNQQPGNVAFDDRCDGFEKAIELLVRVGVRYGGVINVPADSMTQFKVAVEDAIGETGDWARIGLLIGSKSQIPSAVALQADHPAVVMGSFDVSDEIYAALDEGTIKFGMDQQAYLQGYYPIPLLTYMAHTKQHLRNRLIQTGPEFVDSAPASAQRQCEEKFYEVCLPPPPPLPTSDSNTALIITVSVVGGALALAISFLVYRLYKLSKHVEELEKSGPVPRMSIVRKLSSLHLDVDTVVDKARRESVVKEDATSAAAVVVAEEAAKSADGQDDS